MVFKRLQKKNSADTGIPRNPKEDGIANSLEHKMDEEGYNGVERSPKR